MTCGWRMATGVALAESGKHALIVSSVSGDEEFKEKFRSWSTQMVQCLTQELNFSRENISLLMEHPGRDSSGSADSQN
jgi:hypothetical protein